MKKFITDGKVLDSAGISTFDTLEEAKGVWCFWMSVYELEEDIWKDIKLNNPSYKEASDYLNRNYVPVFKTK